MGAASPRSIIGTVIVFRIARKVFEYRLKSPIAPSKAPFFFKSDEATTTIPTPSEFMQDITDARKLITDIRARKKNTP